MDSAQTRPLHDTTGIVLISVLINAFLYGAVCVQAYAFFHRKRIDRLSLRYFVALLCTLDTLQFFTCCHAIYFWLIIYYGEPEYLLNLTWSTNVQIGLTVATCFLVRCYYAYRLWRMSQKNKFVVLPIVVFNLGCIGLGLGLSAYTFVLKRFDQLHRYGLPTTLQLACATAGDAYIALAMVYYLQRGKSGIRRTNSLINKLILWSISTGLLTAIVEFLAMVAWVTMPKTLVYAALEVVLGKLYTNAMLAMLNGRPTGPNEDSRPSLPSPPPDAYTSPDIVFRSVLRTSRYGSDSFSRVTPASHPAVLEFAKYEPDGESVAYVELGRPSAEEDRTSAAHAGPRPPPTQSPA